MDVLFKNLNLVFSEQTHSYKEWQAIENNWLLTQGKIGQEY
jgi:hypothetical protein